MNVEAVRVECGCGRWIRLELDAAGRSPERKCYRCNTSLKAETHGSQVRGYRWPLMALGWIETNVDVSIAA